MNLFDFFCNDWKTEWIETALASGPKWYQLDKRNNAEFIELEKTASKKGFLKLALQIDELRKVRKAQQWTN